MTLREYALRPALGAIYLAGGILGQPLDGLLHRPEHPFAATPAPNAPDYALPETWAAWPGRPSFAQAVPPGLPPPPLPEAAAVDVFFVHPTTFLSGRAWNARFDEPGSASLIVDLTLRNQASVFNGVGRIFAPRYRQASAFAFTASRSGEDCPAFDLAYSDVRRAFEHYHAAENIGRPFVLAGHSQGSMHIGRLLQERVLGSALQSKLVAAYAIGAAVPKAMAERGLPISTQADAMGCIVSWNSLAARSCRFAPALSWLDGCYRAVPDDAVICTNPLSFAEGGTMPASANLGALPGVGLDNDLPALIPGLTGARCRGGRVIVALPLSRRRGFRDAATRLGNYHIYDYNLFYLNLRENVGLRVSRL